MPSLTKSAIVPYPCETMFDLVDDVESYPSFLPWCPAVRLIERTPASTIARIEVSWRGVRTHFATRNAKARPSAMDLALLDGPFDSFGGAWRFTPLGDDGCRVEFSLAYAFSSRAVELALGPVFGQAMGMVVDRFVARAAEVAG